MSVSTVSSNQTITTAAQPTRGVIEGFRFASICETIITLIASIWEWIKTCCGCGIPRSDSPHLISSTRPVIARPVVNDAFNQALTAHPRLRSFFENGGSPDGVTIYGRRSLSSEAPWRNFNESQRNLPERMYREWYNECIEALHNVTIDTLTICFRKDGQFVQLEWAPIRPDVSALIIPSLSSDHAVIADLERGTWPIGAEYSMSYTRDGTPATVNASQTTIRNNEGLNSFYREMCRHPALNADYPQDRLSDLCILFTIRTSNGVYQYNWAIRRT